MFDSARLSYDASTRRLTYDSGVRGTDLLARDACRRLGEIAREGTWEGNEVDAVVVAFGDAEAAQHNADTMSFFGLHASSDGVEYPSREVFPTREDFGIAG